MIRKLFLLCSVIIPTLVEACDVDVQILEGSTVSYCYMSGGTISASPGFVSYSWTGPQNSNSQSFVPMSSGTYTVSAVDAIGCISTASIQVTINPVPNPTINSSEGTTLCPGGSGTLLTVTPAFMSYQWSTGSSAVMVQVTQGGTYTVQVTDFNGCSSNASIFIDEPVFELNASSTTVCTGNSAVLSASGGDSYVWSTGATTSSITVSLTTTTNYVVTVNAGSCSTTLESNINVVPMPNASVEDTFYVAFGEQVTIEGPEGFTGYTWLPEQDLLSYSTQSTIFTGTVSTQYTLTSVSGNGCERTDTIVVLVLRINAPTGFSPNGDNVNDAFVVPELELYDASLIVWNRWGDIVLEEAHYANDWKGTCSAPLCLGSGRLPEGTYYYEITIEGVKFNGFTTLKL